MERHTTAVERLVNTETSHPTTRSTPNQQQDRAPGPLARSAGAVVVVAAVGIGLVFWAGVWVLVIGDLTAPDTVPEPPTHDQLVNQIHTRTEDRQTGIADRFDQDQGTHP